MIHDTEIFFIQIAGREGEAIGSNYVQRYHVKKLGDVNVLAFDVCGMKRSRNKHGFRNEGWWSYHELFQESLTMISVFEERAPSF
jgi:hypothetical protein